MGEENTTQVVKKIPQLVAEKRGATLQVVEKSTKTGKRARSE